MAGPHSPLREGRQLEEKNCIRRITRSLVYKGNVVATSVFGMILIDRSPTLGRIKRVMILPSLSHPCILTHSPTWEWTVCVGSLQGNGCAQPLLFVPLFIHCMGKDE